MGINAEALPNDPEILKSMLREMSDTLRTIEVENTKLRFRIEQLLRHRFGRRSEKLSLDPRQILLTFDPIDAALLRPPMGLLEELEGQMGVGGDESPPARRRKGHGRRSLPEDLPRRRVEHVVPPEELMCPDCGAERTKIGEEVSEQLEYIPAEFLVLQHVRAKHACPRCEGNIVTASTPAQPIEKGVPGPGLLAQVVTAKYADHLPLNRLEGIFRRSGVEIARSTMCGWVGVVADLLAPIYFVMHRSVLLSKVIQTDDTPIPVLDPELDRTRRGHIWVYLGDDSHPDTVYDFTPTHTRDGPRRFLESFEGYLQADAYPGYDDLFRDGRIVEVGCWAHARRYFYDARTSEPALAHIALAFIGTLYEVERQVRELDPEDRLAMRQTRSRKTIDHFTKWLEEQARHVLPKSPFGEAIGYVVDQCEALNRYIDDPDLSIDNNAAERALRQVVIGRNNWLFAGSDVGARRAAILYSLVMTCKRHDIDMLAYLRDVLDRVSTHPAREVMELTPRGWKASRRELAASRS